MARGTGTDRVEEGTECHPLYKYSVCIVLSATDSRPVARMKIGHGGGDSLVREVRPREQTSQGIFPLFPKRSVDIT